MIPKCDQLKGQGMDMDWPFIDPPDVAVFTCDQILKGDFR